MARKQSEKNKFLALTGATAHGMVVGKLCGTQSAHCTCICCDNCSCPCRGLYEKQSPIDISMSGKNQHQPSDLTSQPHLIMAGLHMDANTPSSNSSSLMDLEIGPESQPVNATSLESLNRHHEQQEMSRRMHAAMHEDDILTAPFHNLMPISDGFSSAYADDNEVLGDLDLSDSMHVNDDTESYQHSDLASYDHLFDRDHVSTAAVRGVGEGFFRASHIPRSNSMCVHGESLEACNRGCRLRF